MITLNVNGLNIAAKRQIGRMVLADREMDRSMQQSKEALSEQRCKSISMKER